MFNLLLIKLFLVIIIFPFSLFAQDPNLIPYCDNLLDKCPRSNKSHSQNRAIIKDKLYFVSMTYLGVYQISLTDGTNNGTIIFRKDISIDPFRRYIFFFIEDKIYFWGKSDLGEGFHVTNGDPNDLRIINTVPPKNDLMWLSLDQELQFSRSLYLNKKIIFNHNNNEFGKEFWVFDPAKELFYILKDINPNFAVGSLEGLSDIDFEISLNKAVLIKKYDGKNDIFYFHADGDNDKHEELYVTDGSPENTFVLPFKKKLNYSLCKIFGNKLVVVIQPIEKANTCYGEIWVSDLNSKELIQIEDSLCLGDFGSSDFYRYNEILFSHFISVNNDLYYCSTTKRHIGPNSNFNFALLKSDFTSSNTKVIHWFKENRLYIYNKKIRPLLPYGNNNLIITTGDLSNGVKSYKIDDISGNLVEIPFVDGQISMLKLGDNFLSIIHPWNRWGFIDTIQVWSVNWTLNTKTLLLEKPISKTFPASQGNAWDIFIVNNHAIINIPDNPSVWITDGTKDGTKLLIDNYILSSYYLTWSQTEEFYQITDSRISEYKMLRIKNGKYSLFKYKGATLNKEPYYLSNKILFDCTNNFVSFDGNPNHVDHLNLGEFKVDLYPNPASGAITLRLSESKNGTVELYDLTGRIILRSVLTSESTELSLDGVASGVYTLKVTLDNSFKMIKIVVE